MIFQRTLKRAVTLQGIGLHSGKPAHLTLRPARPGRGIVFVRTDLPGSPEIAGHYKHVIDTRMATTLGRGKAVVSTVEHLLAAVQGMNVDNLIVEIDGPEVPIMDGSSAPFVAAIARVGTEAQLQARPTLVLRRKVELKIAEKWAVAEPSSRLEIHGSIDWDHAAIGYQQFHYVEGRTDFAELAEARTFGFLRDGEALKRAGLARGGSLENAVVLDDARVLNPEGLRFPDEFARHKVLDALGDFKLAGISIRAFFRLHRAGHDLHSRLLTAIFKDPDNFEIIDGAEHHEDRLRASVRAAMAHAGLAATV